MSKRSLFILAVLSLFPITGFAQNSMIRGKVRTADGNTVNNAIVELMQSSGGIIGQVVTRNDGDFSFSGLRSGEYEILVTMAGYEASREVVQLTQGSMPVNNPGVVTLVVSVEITLRPRPERPHAPPATSFVQDVPKAARTAYDKGMAKIRDKKVEEGIALLREATTAFKDYFDAHFALGTTFYKLGKDTEAIESLEHARQINDREGAVYYTFGLVMVRRQNYGAAEYAFGQAVELGLNNAVAHFNHGVALIEVALRTNDADQRKTLLATAEKRLDWAWETSGKHYYAVLFQRARIYENRGDREAAAQSLEAYLKAEPDTKNAAALKESIAKLRTKK